MSFKQEKVIVIISEFVNDKREFYPITNVPVEKARFFYKDDDGLFKVMASSDYAVRTELNETRLYITNVEIKEKSTKFQVGYEINFTSSEYETSLPVLSVLVEMYNNLIEDSRTIFNYVKKQCFISDDKTTSLVLPNLPSYCVWCMGENGEMFALPVSELYSKFGEMLNKLKSILADYTESKKEEIRGATFFPHLMEDGTLSWTNDKNKPNPEPVNIKGPAGTIENVTASVDSNAGTPSVKVTMSGTKENRSFNLEFQNLKGDKPIKGTDYYTSAEKEQFTTETIKLVTAEGTKVVEQVKSIVSENPATTNALTLSGKTRVEFEQDTEKVREELEEKTNDNIIIINKFDINSLKTGYFSNRGEIITQEGVTTNCSEKYIPIKNGVKYIWTKQFYIVGTGISSQQIMFATYDISKKFLEIVSVNKLDTNTKIFNSNVAFIRLSFFDCEVNKDFMFCENKLPKTYVPYRYYLNYDSVYNLEENINLEINKNNLFINNEIDKKINKFIPPKIVKKTEEIAKNMVTFKGNYYPDTKGELAPNNSYWAYEYIIQEDSEILVNSFGKSSYAFFAIYNEEISSFNFVKRVEWNAGEQTKITVKAGQILLISPYLTTINESDINFKGIKRTFNDKVYPTLFQRGMNIAWFGDSISQLQLLPHRVGEYLGVQVSDCSFAGANLSISGTVDSISMLDISNMIVSENWQRLEDYLSAQQNAGIDITEKKKNANTLKSLDFNKITDIVIMIGTNDLQNDYAIVNSFDKFKQSMQTIINNINNKYKHINIYFVSNPYRGDITPEKPDKHGHSLIDIINAEKEISELNNIPFYDLYHNSGINANTIDYYLTGDKLHQNEKGDILMAKKIAKWLKAN